MEKELILCDTNVLISWFKGEVKTLAILERIGLQYVLIPSVTIMELMQGARNKIELVQLKKKMKAYHIIHFNETSSKLTIDLVEQFRLSHG
ncbi:MAG: PIN domain-containing protein, partial [Bacteroidales bacterium]|nr:PIN domain-containing protein [Bacteroidales bacterium]